MGGCVVCMFGWWLSVWCGLRIWFWCYHLHRAFTNYTISLCWERSVNNLISIWSESEQITYATCFTGQLSFVDTRGIVRTMALSFWHIYTGCSGVYASISKRNKSCTAIWGYLCKSFHKCESRSSNKPIMVLLISDIYPIRSNIGWDSCTFRSKNMVAFLSEDIYL